MTDTLGLPESRDGRRLDEEVLEGVLLEAGRIRRLELFVGSFDEDARTRSVLRPTLLQRQNEEARDESRLILTFITLLSLSEDKLKAPSSPNSDTRW